MLGGYFLVDCTGLNLATSDSQSISGIWQKAVTAIASGKPIIAHNCAYGTDVSGNPIMVSPVTAFGWYLAEDEIVVVSATLHIHIKNDDTATVLDVVQAVADSIPDATPETEVTGS